MLSKQQVWMQLANKDKIQDATGFFKKWYMNHTIEWMQGFNEAMELLVDIMIKEREECGLRK